MVSCADSDGGDRVNSLAFDSSLSLQSQWQTVLFLAVPVQNQSSVTDLNNSGSSLSLTSRDLLHTLISHWIHNLTQEESWSVTQCLIWSWANAGGRSTFKSFDKRYFLDNEHSYRKKLYQMWNEYGLPNICFQLLLILCKVKGWWSERGNFPLTCQVAAFGSTGFCVTPVFCGWRRGCWKHSSAHWGSLRRREKITLLL